MDVFVDLFFGPVFGAGEPEGTGDAVAAGVWVFGAVVGLIREQPFAEVVSLERKQVEAVFRCPFLELREIAFVGVDRVAREAFFDSKI